MAIYKVTYGSMTATYGPSYVEADSPEQAKRLFGSCFSEGERAVCMTAREVSEREIREALHNRDNKDND